MGAANKLMGKRAAAAIILRGGINKKPLNSKQHHIQQLNDELAADIIAASGDSDLVKLGIETVGIEQMTALINTPKKGILAQFSGGGYTKEELKKLGHDPASPVDINKPTVMYSAKTMVRRGLAGSRSDIGHEFAHAGMAAQRVRLHSVLVEEAVTRHHDMIAGNPKERATAKRWFERKFTHPIKAHRVAKDLYNILNKQAGLARTARALASRASQTSVSKIGQLMNE